MVRQLRINYENAVYHVLSRGNQRGEIFLDDGDYYLFLDTLKDSVETYGVSIISYVLMKNHYHFIVETPNANLSKFMKHFNITYATRFNKKHQREGHLFQGRFKSIVIEEDSYLLTLSRYIHLNPIRTKYFERKSPKEKLDYLLSYQWSTLLGYINSKYKKDWINYEKILSYFKKKENQAKRSYFSFTKEAVKNPPQNLFEELKYQMVLGTDSFAKKIKQDFLEKEKSIRELPSLRQLKCLSLDLVIEKVADFFGVDKTEVIQRRGGNIKQIAMDLCYKYTNLSQQEIGKSFGNVDYSTVSQNRKRLKQKMQSDQKLSSIYMKIVLKKRVMKSFRSLMARKL
ncbi:MAG: transposase [Actinobacteria bacterium]|nr:transposase [Actinomycetota bacterium]